MAKMKKKKGADDPPVNKNRSDTKNSKSSSVVTATDKGSKGKK